MANSGTPINHVKWGSFLDQLKTANVHVARVAATNAAYLRRETSDGRILMAPLPSAFDETNPDASGYVGCYVFDSVCRKLEVDQHKYFAGWYYIL